MVYACAPERQPRGALRRLLAGRGQRGAAALKPARERVVRRRRRVRSWLLLVSAAPGACAAAHPAAWRARRENQIGGAPEEAA